MGSFLNITLFLHFAAISPYKEVYVSFLRFSIPSCVICGLVFFLLKLHAFSFLSALIMVT